MAVAGDSTGPDPILNPDQAPNISDYRPLHIAIESGVTSTPTMTLGINSAKMPAAEGETQRNLNDAIPCLPGGKDIDSGNIEVSNIDAHWTTVGVRRKSRPTKESLSDQALDGKRSKLPAYIEKIRSSSISLYVVNYPVHWQTQEMWNFFDAYAQVYDVFIPRLGSGRRRFAFVRFVQNTTLDGIIGQLNRTVVESARLIVSKARNLDGDTQLQHADGSEGAMVTKSGIKGSSKTQNGGLNSDIPESAKEEPALEMSFLPTFEESAWLENCLVCFPSPILDIQSMGSILEQQGYIGGSTVRLEGGEVLLKLSSKAEQLRMLVDAITTEKLCSHNLRPWRFIEGKLMRPVWARIRGVPLHCWFPRFFSEACSKVGTVVSIDSKTLDKSEMQLGRALLLTASKHQINCELKVVTKYETFKVKFDEEIQGHWTTWRATSSRRASDGQKHNVAAAAHQLDKKEWPDLGPVSENTNTDPAVHLAEEISAPNPSTAEEPNGYFQYQEQATDQLSTVELGAVTTSATPPALDHTTMLEITSEVVPEVASPASGKPLAATVSGTGFEAQKPSVLVDVEEDLATVISLKLPSASPQIPRFT